MKIYKLVYNANKPSDKQVLVPNYETNKVGVIVIKDGEKIELAEEDVMLVDGSTEIEADGTYSDMITLPITTGRFDENKTYKVKIENDDVSLVFNLVVNSVKSSVIEVDSEGSEYELPIASAETLGGIKVGDNLTIDEDGTLNAEDGEETDPVFTEWKGGTEIAAGSTSAAIGDNSAAYGFHSQGIGASSLALGAHARAEGQGSVQIGQGTNSNDGTFQVGSYQMLDSRGEVPRDRLPLATPTGKGVVKVGDGLTIDSDGKLNVTGGSETDPVFTTWKGGQNIVAGASTVANGTGIVAIGGNTTVGQDGDSYDVTAIGSTIVVPSDVSHVTAIGAGILLEGTNDDDVVAIGYNARVGYSAPNTVVVGANAMVSDANGIAIGCSASSSNQSIVIGCSTTAMNYNLAIGPEITNIAGYAVAIGRGFTVPSAAGNGVAIGTSVTLGEGDQIAIGTSASCGSFANAIAIGKNAEAIGANSVALGYDAYVSGNGAVQLGQGVNETNSTLQFQGYQLCDASGKVPAARLPIASTSTVGGVKVGQNLTVTADGTLNAQASYNAAIIVQPYRAQGEWYISQGQLKEQPIIMSPYTDPIKNPPLYFINPLGSQTEIHTIVIVENGIEVRYECESEDGMPLNYSGTPLFLLGYERGQLYFWGYNNAMLAWVDPMPDGETLQSYTFTRTN